MVVKKIISILLPLIVILGALWVFKGTNLQQSIQDLSQQRIYIQRQSNVLFMPDWKPEDLLPKINMAREASGSPKLTESSKLDQAAKARLSVILTENDYDGTVTGLTREKALQNAGYDANMVGELILTGFYKTNDPISFWKSVSASKDTLNYAGFKDVGIAIINNNEKVDVYVLLVSPRKVTKAAPVRADWSGPQLWDAINKRRVERGVNPLKQQEELCTIASIRLNQLLALGTLDGHAGFVPLLNRPDIKPITEKLNISEFLVQGYPTPLDSVNAWENTMGHKSLLEGGEYVWGCVYAQNTIGVAIAAY